MWKIDIHKVSLGDLEKLQHIGRQTFLETFAESNTADDMQKYLSSSFSSDKLADELVNPNSEFYFATFSNKIIGYLKINFGQSQTELKDKHSLEIERIYVLKEFQGKKIGQLLYDHAFLIAQQKKSNYLWLGVWEKNSRAIDFYRKNGFIEFDKHVFKLGEDQQTDIMMKLVLNDMT
ncbi:MAG: GNAT family N-acetyltransferase [Bacteroidetes bacterium]|nr:GNAT family N-acetyltransferase [Bacteroidota bacterium]